MTVDVPATPCAHAHDVAYRDENDDRIRTLVSCRICDRAWSGCYAKRLDSEGRTAWGPPGEWWYREARRPSAAAAPSLAAT